MNKNTITLPAHNMSLTMRLNIARVLSGVNYKDLSCQLGVPYGTLVKAAGGFRELPEQYAEVVEDFISDTFEQAGVEYGQ